MANQDDLASLLHREPATTSPPPNFIVCPFLLARRAGSTASIGAVRNPHTNEGEEHVTTDLEKNDAKGEESVEDEAPKPKTGDPKLSS